MYFSYTVRHDRVGFVKPIKPDKNQTAIVANFSLHLTNLHFNLRFDNLPEEAVQNDVIPCRKLNKTKIKMIF